MPIVTIETWPMDEQNKPEMMMKITDIFTGMGIPAEAVTVIIYETKQNNWASAGEQHSVRFKKIIENMEKNK